MKKNVKFGLRELTPKVVYAIVIAILCVTAIVVGIVAAASKSKDSGEPQDTPPVIDGGGDNTPPPDDTPDDTPSKEALYFVSPVVGSVATEHAEDAPVFSITLGEWRLHTGIEILTEEDAPVYAAEDGTVSAVYKDALLGYTVEITHDEDTKTVYSNLKGDELVTMKVGDEVKSGDRIGTVGDTAITELADEAHLHFELFYKGEAKNPLDYISEESKEASLRIKE